MNAAPPRTADPAAFDRVLELDEGAFREIRA